MSMLPALKRALGIPAGETSRDADLNMCATAAAEWFSTQTGYYFGEPRAAVERFDGDGVTDTLFLRSTPADSPAFKLESLNGETWEEWDATEYEVDNRRVILKAGAWPRGRRNLRATYTEGFEAGKGPAGVQRAILTVAVAMWKETKAGNYKSESIGGYSYTLNDETILPQFVRDAVNAYRRVRF